ncbi:MAG: hypothetical protein LC803_11385 [Acidobacteria bacterium]|nr:hypothetical protein [Acidobacteriota bacterium]
MKSELIDHITAIFKEAEYKTLAALHVVELATKQETQPVSDWLTPTELAVYWRCFNKQGVPTTSGILSWARRPLDQYPLPHAYMGDMMRFHRDEANQWAKEEAERRRIENERRRLKLAG